MFKKLREKCKNKKGFTMVELIVVIVIILVLAGALVPSLMKYVDSAKKANCKADAATLLSQIQADYAGAQATDETEVDAVQAKYNDVTVTTGTAPATITNAVKGTKQAVYVVDGTTKEITSFAYYDGDVYTATWTDAAEWNVSEQAGVTTP